jgi:hypothetical protein
MVAIRVVRLQQDKRLITCTENKQPHTHFDLEFVSPSCQLVTLGAFTPTILQPGYVPLSLEPTIDPSRLFLPAQRYISSVITVSDTHEEALLAHGCHSKRLGIAS